MAKSTSNTPFFSRSESKNTTRWRLEPTEGMVRGYVIDLVGKGLPHRWYLLGLTRHADSFSFRVYAYGPEVLESVSLDEEVLAEAQRQAPVIHAAVDTPSVQEAIERFERTVSNVTHNLLAPLPQCQKFWDRFATSDGTHAYRA